MEKDSKKEALKQPSSQPEAFLQSATWSDFQQKAGRRTFEVGADHFQVRVVEHVLPLVGKYFYAPRGPIFEKESSGSQIAKGMQALLALAKKENAGWIRIEPTNEAELEMIRKSLTEKVLKCPHDVQPKEIFVLDITKSQEQLLAEMKSKTRYNINLASKKGVVIEKLSKQQENKTAYLEAFLALTQEMAARQGITVHPAEYYRKMLESFPAEMLEIYVAKYAGKILAANLVLFHEKTATYLHGASSDEDRNVMAPFLLQWQAILDAKNKGCESYDFGGVKTVNNYKENNNWQGITNFKLGFSPETKPVIFPGAYDIVINARSYATYRGLQKAKSWLHFKRK